MVSRAKLIAEPWDVGQADSYDIGRFPPLWREWNGSYRDTMRDFWRSHGGLLGEFATRFAGSSDLYGGRGRRPTASVNLITVHDGFTLADLVSYDTKHNEANGEGNRDGTDDNRSWNCGVEGPTDDRRSCDPARPPAARPAHHAAALVRRPDAARRGRARPHPAGQQQRLLPGQPDSPGSTGRHVDEDLLAFTRRLIAFRLAHPVFRRRRFLSGTDRGQLRWFTPAGTLDDRERVGATPSARSVAHPPRRRRRARPRRRRQPADRRRLPRAGQRLVGAAGVHRPADPSRPDLAPGDRHLRPGSWRSAERSSVADPVAVGPRSVVVLRGSPGR